MVIACGAIVQNIWNLATCVRILGAIAQMATGAWNVVDSQEIRAKRLLVQKTQKTNINKYIYIYSVGPVRIR